MRAFARVGRGGRAARAGAIRRYIWAGVVRAGETGERRRIDGVDLRVEAGGSRKIERLRH